jgi:hypothetical protein
MAKIITLANASEAPALWRGYGFEAIPKGALNVCKMPGNHDLYLVPVEVKEERNDEKNQN